MCFSSGLFRPSVLAAALTLTTVRGFASPETQGTGEAPPELSALLRAIQSEKPGYVGRESNGAVVSLTVPRDIADDNSLEIIARLVSLRDLRIYAKQDQASLTRRGIKWLGGLTNLTTLRLRCGGPLAGGILQEVSRLRQLKELEIVACEAPSSEFASLTNLNHLVTLRVGYTRSFGDDELRLLTSLTNLASVELDWTSVSKNGTNILSGMRSVTNIVIGETLPSRP